MPVNRFYLDQIVSMEFKGVEWTREKILEVRDLLSPWNHNIALPHGVYTAACDDYYPAHREIMRIVRERLGSDFSGRRIVDIGCLEGYFSIECALQGAEVLGIDGKLLNVRKCEFVRSVLGVERATFALGDAMKVTRESSGGFDAVLALGLLYYARNAAYSWSHRRRAAGSTQSYFRTRDALAGPSLARFSMTGSQTDGHRPSTGYNTMAAIAGQSPLELRRSDAKKRTTVWGENLFGHCNARGTLDYVAAVRENGNSAKKLMSRN